MSDYSIPLLLGILIMLLFLLLAWGFIRLRSHNPSAVSAEMPDSFILTLLLLAALAMGMFLAYLLLGFQN